MTDPTPKPLQPTEGKSEKSTSSVSTQRGIVTPGPLGGAGSPSAPAPVGRIDADKTAISKKPPIEVSSAGDSPAKVGGILEGQRLGHYELLEFIGGGGMGTVFRAVDTMLDRIVAVKVLLRERNSDEEMVRRFKNEAQNAARLDHRNIARVYFVDEQEGWYYIVFEFIDGINIRDLVNRDGPMSVPEAIRYTLNVAEALDHAAQRDVVHRDIKPSNILITPEGEAKLVDMGLARLHQIDDQENDLTASGVTLGTFDYISPEQAKDPREADVRSDLYSLGCTLYFMLTSRPPFPDGTVLQKLLSHSADPPPDPRVLRPELPVEVTKLLNTMLAKRPDRRHQTPGELTVDLLMMSDQLGIELGATNTTYQLASEAAPPAIIERHLPWLVSVSLLILFVVAVEFVFSPEQTASDTIPEFRMPATEVDEIPDGTVLPPAGVNGGGQSPTAGTEPESPLKPGSDPDSEVPAVEASIGNDSVSDGGDLSASSGAGGELTAADESNGGISTAPVPPEPVAGAAIDDGRLHILVGDRSQLGSADINQIVLSSLAEAVAEADEYAAKNPIIELCYDGVRKERPVAFSLAQGPLTIRAGKGYTPVLRFEPVVGDAILYPRTMLQVSDGELTLENISIEMEAPVDQQVEFWTLFRLQDMRQVQLKNCALSIIYGDQDNNPPWNNRTSFFLVESLGNRFLSVSESEARALKSQIPLTFENCVFRGNASMVRSENAIPLRLKWTNGLFASTEQLLRIGGSSDESVQDDYVKLALSRVTIAANAGLCMMKDNEKAPYLPTLDIEMNDCIVTTDETSALIQQQGVGTVASYRQRLVVRGRRNFYQNIAIFWRINAQKAEDQVVELDWRTWRQTWAESELSSSSGGVQWARELEPGTLTHEVLLDDYRLDEHPSNPAFDSGAGFDFEKLSSLLNDSMTLSTDN